MLKQYFAVHHQITFKYEVVTVDDVVDAFTVCLFNVGSQLVFDVYWFKAGPASKQSSIDSDIDLAVNIFSQFNVDQQLKSATKVVGFLHKLLNCHGTGTGFFS